MKNKILNILKKNGFLIILFICVCVVAVSTIFISTRELVGNHNANGKKEDLAISNEVGKLQEDNEFIGESIENIIQGKVTEELFEEDSKEEKLVESEEAKAQDEIDQEEVKDEGQVDQEKELVEVERSEEETVEVFNEIKEYAESTGSIMPLEGEIIQKHSIDTLVYSETLGEWRAHLGIDIRAAIGTRVKAVLDGKVKKAYHDKLWGYVIILEHGNGLETKYSNLKTLEMVKEGVQVIQGDHISLVGKSADIEMLMEDHLHFEVIKDGKVIDPRSIMD